MSSSHCDSLRVFDLLENPPEPTPRLNRAALKEKLIKIGAKIVSHGRYVAFQMAEVAIRGIYSPTSCG